MKLIAERKGTQVGDVMVVVLDRPRHEQGVKAIREAGARVRLIAHGDVSASLLGGHRALPGGPAVGHRRHPGGRDLRGGDQVPGGQLLGRVWPRDEQERTAALEAGYDLKRVLDRDDLVAGEDVFFSATGITDGDVLQGVRYPSAGGATHGVAGDAHALGHRAADPRAARPREAACGRSAATGLFG